MTSCTFPHCPSAATAHNRAGQDVCKPHEPVVITGSWVPDHHDATSGGEH
nr:hypothetical protein [Aeromicrobium sp.]